MDVWLLISRDAFTYLWPSYNFQPIFLKLLMGSIMEGGREVNMFKIIGISSHESLDGSAICLQQQFYYEFEKFYEKCNDGEGQRVEHKSKP